MLAETLDDWEEAVRKEVERQAFIDASLGPREFHRNWNTKQDQKRDRQGKWRRGGAELKVDRDHDAMDVNVVYLPEVKDKEEREKQCIEGCCFTCNKQGHVKRNCPSAKQDESPRRSCPVSSAQAVQTNGDRGSEVKRDAEGPAPKDVEDLMTKLRGMSVDEKEEVIDALVTQENF